MTSIKLKSKKCTNGSKFVLLAMLFILAIEIAIIWWVGKNAPELQLQCAVSVVVSNITVPCLISFTRLMIVKSKGNNKTNSFFAFFLCGALALTAISIPVTTWVGINDFVNCKEVVANVEIRQISYNYVDSSDRNHVSSAFGTDLSTNKSVMLDFECLPLEKGSLMVNSVYQVTYMPNSGIVVSLE